MTLSLNSFRLPADDLEYAVLSRLWRLGTASIGDLHHDLAADNGLGYTTVATVMDRLRGKGLVQRERHGQAFVYQARIPPQDVERARARDALRRLLGPTPKATVAALVDAVSAVDPKLLEELERAVATRRRASRGT
jgi:predicted transcriptional regulator